MLRTPSLFNAIAALIMLGALLLSGCGSAPVDKLPPQVPAPAGREQFQTRFDDDFSLDYQVERTISKLNGRSCFAFITGTLHNHSAHTLSKQSVLDFMVFSKSRQLFRDLSNPVSDVAPGAAAAFVMVVSPVHADGCPPYDKISVSLRKVFLR